MNEMVEKDFIDITPRGIDGGKGYMNANVVFQEHELKMIQENPSNLTKEGIAKKIELWKHSQNRQVQALYKTMAVKCKIVSESGVVVEKTKDGEVKKQILSRKKDGSPNWLDEPVKIEKPEVKKDDIKKD